MSISHYSGGPDAFQACLDQIAYLSRRQADARIRRAVVDLQLVIAAIYGPTTPNEGPESEAALFVSLVGAVPSEFMR